MILRDIIGREPFVFIVLLAVSTASYFQFTFSELRKEKKGEKDILTPLRWIIFCFIGSLFFLWIIPFLFLINMISGITTNSLSIFETLTFLHILVVSLFIILGGLPAFFAKRREMYHRVRFRLIEFGYTLYLAIIAGFGFLGEIRVSLITPFKGDLEFGRNIVELLIIMAFLFLGSTVMIVLMGKYAIRLWARGFTPTDH